MGADEVGEECVGVVSVMIVVALSVLVGGLV